MKSPSPKNIDAYLASVPEETCIKLIQLRKLIQSLAPQAKETMSYGMPAFKVNGKSFVAFAAYKHHIGFYPMSGSFLSFYEKDLKNYKTSKGAVQFPIEKPLPIALIKKLIKSRLKSHDQGSFSYPSSNPI